MAGFHFSGILTILLFVATLNYNFANGSPQSQRNRLTSRFQTIRSSTTTEAASSTLVSNRRRGGSPTSTSHVTDGPVSRLRRPTRTTTTPIPPASEVTSSRTTQNDAEEQSSEPNSIRKELIEKLCNRKYGHTSQSGPEQVPKSGTDIGTASEDEAKTAFQSQQTHNQRLRGRARPRRALRRISRPTTTSTTTQNPETMGSRQPQFVCHDFDNLTTDQLMNRVKNGRRRKNPMQQNIVS